MSVAARTGLPRAAARAACGARSTIEPVRPRAVAASPYPDPAAIETLAGWIAQAERPLITRPGGHARRARSRCSPRLPSAGQFRLCSINPRRSICRTATRCMSDTTGPLIGEADLIIVLECEVPWYPVDSSRAATAGSRTSARSRRSSAIRCGASRATSRSRPARRPRSPRSTRRCDRPTGERIARGAAGRSNATTRAAPRRQRAPNLRRQDHGCPYASSAWETRLATMH